MQRLLIAGGTGFIGKALVKHFQEKEQFKCTVLTRYPRRAKKIFGESIECLNWNNLRPEHTFDVVIQLAGKNLFSGWTRSKKHLQQVVSSRLTTTQKLVDWLWQQTTPTTFIVASGISIYPADGQVYSEFTPLSSQSLPSPNFMGNLSFQWEEVANSAPKSHVRVINMRLGVVLSPEGGFLARVLPTFRVGLGCILGSGHQPFPWIALEDVINIIDFLLEHQEISGCVNFVAPDIINYETLAKSLAESLGRECKIHLPKFIIKALMGNIADELILTGPKVEPKVLIANGFTFDFPSHITYFKNKFGLQ